MIPVIQTKVGVPGGNCFAACLASLFELPSADDVPNFCYDVPDGEDWMEPASRWCIEQFGFGLFTMRSPEGAEWDDAARYMSQFFERSGAYVIAGVHTARGRHLHAVVMQAGKVIHDPYPGGSEVVGRPVDYTILFPVDVADHTCRRDRPYSPTKCRGTEAEVLAAYGMDELGN